MDFDDLLYVPAMALRLNEEFRADLDARFRYVLIDEYQDTNQAQYEIARRLSIHHPNLCVVGDPDQSIYKWRGSDICRTEEHRGRIRTSQTSNGKIPGRACG